MADAITPEQYAAAVTPWESVFGPIETEVGP